MMKKKILLYAVCCIFFITKAAAQKYMPVESRSKIGFSIKNFGLLTDGAFKGLKGNIKFDVNNTATCSFTITVEANTIYTGNNVRDKHLKKEEYFNVAKYPVLSFTSTKIVSTATPGVLNISGKLSIKGVSKDISFPFTAVAQSDGYVFEGNFKLNRRDFGVGGSSFVMSDNVNVTLLIFGMKE